MPPIATTILCMAMSLTRVITVAARSTAATLPHPNALLSTSYQHRGGQGRRATVTAFQSPSFGTYSNEQSASTILRHYGVPVVSTMEGRSKRCRSFSSMASSTRMAPPSSSSALRLTGIGASSTGANHLDLSSTRVRSFHASSTQLMGKRNAVRKKAGGKNALKRKNNRKPKPTTDAEEDAEQEDGDTPLDELSEFAPEFASEYHAPVMPTECIDAMIGEGLYGKLWRRRLNKLKRFDGGVAASKYRRELKEEDEHGESSEEQPQRPRGLYIDGTLGGGGHSQALLEKLNPGDVLIACDVDPDALETASERLADYLVTREFGTGDCRWEEGRPIFVPVRSNFGDLVQALSKVRHPQTGRLLLGLQGDDAGDNDDDDDGSPDNEVEFAEGVDGMLLDLGVSSHQINTADRGFAFMKDGPLDMRMSGNKDNDGSNIKSLLTAADICNEFDEAALASILREYGDEPRARRISEAIAASRPLRTTTDLVKAINTVTPTMARQRRAGLIATSARVFQALRIVVNEEDKVLRDVLEKVAPTVLRKDGGRLVVLSYHSMEDKMSKRVMRDGSADRSRASRARVERDIYGNVIEDEDAPKPFEPLGKPQKATEEEVEVNSRSRSAILRVAVRV